MKREGNFLLCHAEASPLFSFLSSLLHCALSKRLPRKKNQLAPSQDKVLEENIYSAPASIHTLYIYFLLLLLFHFINIFDDSFSSHRIAFLFYDMGHKKKLEMTQDMDSGNFEWIFLPGFGLGTTRVSRPLLGSCETQTKIILKAPVNNQFIFPMFIGFNK